jgi:hypothetical protein
MRVRFITEELNQSSKVGYADQLAFPAPHKNRGTVKIHIRSQGARNRNMLKQPRIGRQLPPQGATSPLLIIPHPGVEP